MSNSLSSDWQGVKNVLVVRMDNIGDVILLSPALMAIKENLPGAKITLLASPGGAQAAPLIPCLDDTIAWPALWQELKNRFGLDPARELSLVEELHSRHFDAAFIFTSFSQSPYPPAYACYLAEIPVRVGHSHEFGGGVLSHWYQPPEDSGHQAERNLALLESAGFQVNHRRLDLKVPAEARQTVTLLLKSLGILKNEPYIVYAPGASADSRRYSPEKAGVAAQLLAHQTGLKVLVAGSEREREKIAGALNACDGKQLFDISGKTDLQTLAALIEGAELVIANNSASLHLAEALQTPMVITYSGTEYLTQWAPRYTRSILLNREVECSPCFSFQCPYQMECLEIEPEEIVQAAQSLLGSSQPLPILSLPAVRLDTTGG